MPIYCHKKSGWSVCYKNYLKVDNKNNPISRSAPHKNLIQGVLNTHASLEIIKIFGEKNFSHPKPEELLQRIIELSTKKGDLVLDYHLGSGTTCAVAHKMGRQYIGIEQMDYIEDIAVKRMHIFFVDFGYFFNKGLIVFIQFKINKFTTTLPINTFRDEDLQVDENVKALNKGFYNE
jgi:DNA modification methylase